MPVPSDITALSAIAASNSPLGSESPATADDYFRAHAAFIAQLRAVIGGAADPNIPNAFATIAQVVDQSQNSGTTAGTSTAYTLAPATAIAAYTTGKSFWVTFHAASGASPTLQISGLGTPPALVKQLFDGTFVAIAAGDITLNHRSRVTLISTTQALVESLPAHSDTLNTTRINIASAATVNLTTGAPNTRHINITGAVAITGFTVAAGQCYFARLNGATLTNNANIVTQTGASITTAAGDTCILRATAANVVEVLGYVPALSPAIGSGQTWQDVTGSRVSGTTYTNSTGKAIQVYVGSVAGAGNTISIVVSGVAIASFTEGADSNQCTSFIVPVGATYSITGSFNKWSELR